MLQQKHILVFISLILLMPVSGIEAEQNSNCTAGLQDPVYSLTNPNIVKYEFEREKFRINEKFETKDGLVAEISHGGCAHYGFSIRIPFNVKKDTVVDDHEVFVAALEFLKKLTIVDPKVIRVTRIYSALSAYKNPKNYKLGEAITETKGYSYFTVGSYSTESTEFFASYHVVL